MRISRVLTLCLQAEEQGLLKGDLNMAQIAALSLCEVYHAAMRRAKAESMWESVSEVVDLYIQLNFPKVYDEMQGYRDYREMNERDPDADIIAENMTDLFNKVMAMEG